MISRRDLIRSAPVALALAGCKKSSDDSEVTANEDLMREHGILERVLVAYDAAAKRLEAGDRGVLDQVRAAARIAREFVEDYHEKIEEMFVFPRLERAGKLADLTAVLREQHDAGREITARVLRAQDDPAQLAALLRGYSRMFVPHAAREDTVLFPAFKDVAGHDYGELGERFEDEEKKHFGKDGFEHYVAMLPPIEQALGVGDLGRFTIRPDDAINAPGDGSERPGRG